MTRLRVGARRARWRRVAAFAAPRCSKADTAPPVATVSFTSNKTRRAARQPDRVDLSVRRRARRARSTATTGCSCTSSMPTATPVLERRSRCRRCRRRSGSRARRSSTRARGSCRVVPYSARRTIDIGLYRDNRAPAAAGARRRRPRVDGPRLQGRRRSSCCRRRRTSSSIDKSGWHPAEFAPDDPTLEWQWTQKTGDADASGIRARTCTLYLEYDARPDLFQRQAAAGDRARRTTSRSQRSRPTAARSPLEKIPITAAQLGTDEMAELRIEVDQTFVPAKLPAGGTRRPRAGHPGLSRLRRSPISRA